MLEIFQSTLPRGERLLRGKKITDQAKISIHAPAWGATVPFLAYECANIHFNPRSRVGSDVLNAISDICVSIFQSTLPRGERRFPQSISSRWEQISIHAPAWGATRDRGSTHETVIFQSTLPRGERRVLRIPLLQLHSISIHAPAWGATVRRNNNQD